MTIERDPDPQLVAQILTRFCNLSDVEVSHKRRKLIGKQPDPKKKPSPKSSNGCAEEFRWVCRLCSAVVTGIDARMLNWHRLNNFKTRRPRRQKTNSDKFVKFKPNPVIASRDIPSRARDWGCPFCRKGLPQCETLYIRATSTRHHWKTDHPNEDTSCAAVCRKRKENCHAGPEAEPTIKAGNKRKAAHMITRHAAKRDMSRNGHALIPFVPNWSSWKSSRVDASNQVGPFSICACCWRFGHYRIFTTECRAIKICFRWNPLENTNGRILAKLWNTSLTKANQDFGVDEDPPSIQKLSLAKAWSKVQPKKPGV